MTIDQHQAQAFLAQHYSTEIAPVTLVGEGAWSRCFAFSYQGEELVVRFGRHVADFERDALAATFARPQLPIPRVLAIGPAFDGYYAISTRVRGAPLEEVTTAQWYGVVPSLVAALEALRTADVSASSGWGDWKADGQGAYPSWPAFLLAVADDSPQQRTHGWRTRLATSPFGAASFDWGLARLQALVMDAGPRGIVHCDLMNRNVLVDDGRLSGVFDWGCALYGDHLYDLAWFEFWAPWSPNLDVPFLRAALAQRWQAAGYTPQNLTARLRACYLHIGLGHLAYNAHRGTWETLEATAARMRELVAD